MLGTEYNFDMHRGDSRIVRFNVVNTDTPPVAIDLTGVTSIEFELTKSDPNNVPAPLGAALFAKGIGTGVTVEDAVNGVVAVQIDEADTTGFQTPADYYYEVQAVLSGDTSTILFGIISLKRDRIAPGP